MKILKILGGSVLSLLLILLITPAFLSSRGSLERSIEIQAKPSKTFAFLADFKNFKKWNPFLEIDPTAHIEVQGTGAGSTYYWKGNESGEGKMEITHLQPDQLVQIRMDFIQPIPSKAEVHWKIESNQNFSKVTWSMQEDFSYFCRFFGLYLDKMIGPAFEKGLQNLKKQLESNA